MESPVLKICGLTDHVHILCMLSKKNRLDEVAGRVEIAFIQVDKNQRCVLRKLLLSGCHCAFSLKPSRIDIIRAYIENLHEHHRKNTFQEEYGGILKKYKVEYGERYVWD